MLCVLSFLTCAGVLYCRSWREVLVHLKYIQHLKHYMTAAAETECDITSALTHLKHTLRQIGSIFLATQSETLDQEILFSLSRVYETRRPSMKTK